LPPSDTLSVALGLSGAENTDASPFRKHFESAAREGLHRVAHAGTQRGPDSIREVLEICGAERVGHGVGAIEDGNLSAELSEKGVSVEICPTDWSTHTVDQLRDQGIPVSINSDRPQLFQTNLTREYFKLHRSLGYAEEQLAELAVAGIGLAFLTEQGRRDLEEEFHRRLDGLRSSRSER
jgi:adenosine deaminase